MYLGHMFSHQLNSGDEIKDVKPHLQINFVKGLNIKSRNYTIIVEDEPHEYFIKDFFNIKVLNVDDSKNIRYNELDKLNRLLKFMSAESDEEEKEIIRGDEMLESIYKDKWKFLQDEWANEFFTHDNYVKSVHNAEMDNLRAEKDEVIYNYAKDLYKQNKSFEEIANITKLIIDTIKNIINN